MSGSSHELSVSQSNPERLLLAAILEQAVVDAISETEHTKSAIKWFDSPSNRPYSFKWVCDHLDVRPQSVVDRIRFFKSETSASAKKRLKRRYRRNSTMKKIRPRWRHAHDLRSAGFSFDEIARRMNVDRKTVYNYTLWYRQNS